MKDFRKLQVWEKAHQLALTLYHVTTSFPRDETYGLVSQIRRSASSIPSNIAEGCGRDGDAELARFCLIARGSASELQYQILLAHDLKLIPSGRYEELSQEITEIKRMKDKRNKRHVGSIRPAFDRFPGRITASYNALCCLAGRAAPVYAFFLGGRILEQTVYGQSRAVEAWRPAHPLGVYPDKGILFVWNQCSSYVSGDIETTMYPARLCRVKGFSPRTVGLSVLANAT